MNEDQLEQLCLEWFSETGWQINYGPDIAHDGSDPKRQNFHQVTLNDALFDAFKRINPHIPRDQISLCFEQVLNQLLKPESLDLVTNNRNIHQGFINGFVVEYKIDGEAHRDYAFLIDFNNSKQNQFLAVNQFTVIGTKQPRRPDIVCFINGLPIAVIELKSPVDEKAGIQQAFDQLQTYKNEIPDLFLFNEALVISDGYNARVGSLTADEERFMPWRTIRHENDRPLVEWELETLVRGFFDPERLLDYLRFFILFENANSGRQTAQYIKKIAGYHQFHAVREAVQATIYAQKHLDDRASTPKLLANGRTIQTGSKKAGVVWHTQGSGKSISMCCYAAMLLRQGEMANPTLVIVTDRNDLDGQLFATFASAESLLNQSPQQAENRDDLREQLSQRESGGIIFTTIQKFAVLGDEKTHPALNTRHNIVVISDEAHRSQYGLNAKLVNDEYKYGYAKHLRDALPNATFIGFTGTPIAQEDRDTRAVFGDYVSIYDIQDAVEDGATVPIYYEARLAKLDLNHAEIEALSQQVEEVIEDEEDINSREKTKGEWSRLEKLVGAAPRLAQIAADIVEHFATRNATMEGKGMIVAMSREICVQLYDQIVAIRPEWHDTDPEKGAIKIIMTGSASDKAHLQPHLYSKEVKKRLEKRFKDPNDPLQLVIVRDMWLTGFDAPACHTMYIDKPMKGHNLMQAIARVNRVFKDKTGGLVVDYIGIANDLRQALRTYTGSAGKGSPTLDAEEAFAVFAEKIDALRGMFAKSPQGEGLDISQHATQAHKLLVPAANYLLGLEDGKKRFLDLVLAATKAYSLCNTLEAAKPYKTEVAFYNAIKTAFAKLSTGGFTRTADQKNSLLKHILDNAVIADGVTDLYQLCGLERPNIGLLSEEFLAEVRELPQKNLAVELLKQLLQDNIKAKSRNNLVQEKKYGDRLQETLRKYHNRAIESVEVIEELIIMAKEIHEAMQREAELGLTPDEIAFYDALATNESAVRELKDETLKIIAKELAEKLRQSTTVDWQVRESVRARLRTLVRRILQKYKYPPDKTPNATDLILKQAETLSNEWSR